jgi:hypothetical protein
MKATLGLILISMCCAGSTKSKPDLVLLAFKHGDFIPHVFTDQQITREHGTGVVSRTNAEMNRIYTIAPCKTWLKLAVDLDAAAEYRIVQELTVSSIPLSKEKFPYKVDLCKISLVGISLGDSKVKVMKSIKGKLVTKRQTALAGQNVEELYVNPSSDESDLYYRFYLREAVVVGLSIGVTE